MENRERGIPALCILQINKILKLFYKEKIWYTFEIVTNFIGEYFVNKDNSNDCKRRKD